MEAGWEAGLGLNPVVKLREHWTHRQAFNWSRGCSGGEEG